MNNKVIIVGAFHEMIELCEVCGFQIVGIIDNQYTGDYNGIPILGTDEDASHLYKDYSDCSIVITPDLPKVREKLSELYSQIGFQFATVISPKAIISRSAKIGRGTVIQACVNVSAGSTIGDFVKLNTYANIMHDDVVGNFATIAPNAVLLGYVHIGESAYIGANSTVLSRVRIGSGSTVGAGAVVTKDVNDNVIVKGVPAK